jgi:hypothetical protein
MLRIKLKKNQKTKKKEKNNPKMLITNLKNIFQQRKVGAVILYKTKTHFSIDFFTSKNLINLNKFIYGFKY